jgi:hypothetical protein
MTKNEELLTKTNSLDRAAAQHFYNVDTNSEFHCSKPLVPRREVCGSCHNFSACVRDFRRVTS